ncbi:MAG TPA: MXAN_5187 C-terminal domain-containing protein [Blastocatellia bacterium]|nr:MXAN_5187 C-terminal domain-containing protein [Blastocatellia bacterium]
MPQLQAPPTLNEELDRLEDDLRRLKIEFDVFFAGGSKRPPIETRNRIETVIRRLGDDRSLRYEQRYRFSGLSHRYNTFRDLWRRLMQQREEGRWQTGYFKSSEPTTPEAPPAPPKVASETPVKAAAADPLSVTLSDPSKEREKVRQLFDMILDSKKKAGEDTSKVSFTQFTRLIASRTEQVKQAGHCNEVTYNVTVENGSVKFTAKGKRG